ncbi:MAG: leucine-rich repeat domain-containing protein [Bacteroidales bacterium]|nr:leucine-rich repeat domain-containing protein [Bacteroidales bacterium]
MKKLFAIILFAIVCNYAMAYDFSAVCSTGQTLYYNITSNVEPYTVEVTSETGSGYNTQPTGDLEIPETVEYNSITYSVTGIGNYALYKSSGLSSLIIPNSVTSIGNYAIRDCSGLTSITIPNSVTSIGTSAFYHVRNVMYDGTATGSPWSALTVNGYVEDGLVYTDNTKEHLTGCSTLATSVNISSSVISIGDYTFDGCTGLTSVTIPNSVITIGHSAFAGCSGLTEITIGNSVTSIGNYAFYNCSGLTSIDMPNSVTSVGESAITGTGWLNNQPDGIIYLGKSCIGYKGSQPTGNLALDDEIKGIASSAFKDCTGITSVTAPSSIVSIGELAFARCTGLTEITIPDSATSIGSRVFMGCSELTTVNFNAKNCTTMPSDVWQNCSALATLNIGEKVKNIPDYAFYSCTGLTEITIPDSVTSIGDRAFYGCSGLTTVNFNAQNCTTMGGTNPVFEDCPLLATLNIGENVKSISENAFYGCTGLSEITIPDSITSIGEMAFYGCTGLTTVNFNAKNCTTMGSSSNPVFYNCTSFSTLNIGENVENIPGYAFRGCSGLETITIGNSLESIGDYAFDNCSSLTAVYISDISQWCAISFAGLSTNANPLGLAHNLYINNELVTDLVLPNTITEIKPYVFKNATCLTSVTIPSSVTSIGYQAFYGCSNLTTVNFNAENCTTMGSSSSPVFYNCTSFSTLNIGERVKSIPDYAFSDCTGLTEITIPDSVTNIGSYAFRGCSGLTEITIPDLVVNIGSQAFNRCSSLSVVNFNAENCTTMGTLSSPVFFNNTSITTLNIGERVKSIPDYAFSDCSALTEITIPDSVTSIGQKAFYACSGLTTLNFNAKNCTVMGSSSSHVFDNCTSLSTLNIGENVKILPDCAFYNCSALTDVTIPDSVVSIGERAFYGCSTLATVNFNAENCTTMGSSSYKVFEEGAILTTLNIGEKVKNIPDYAFYGCSNMTGTLVIPDSVINIGTYAFGRCSSLDTLTIDKSVESIGERAFDECSELTAVNFNAENCTTMGSSSNPAFYNCTSFATLNISEKVKNIPNYAFWGCTGLTTVNFNAENCTTMGTTNYAAFYNGTFTTLNIGERVKNIPSYAFYKCSGLTEITIPDSVTSIGNNAFRDCSGLTTVNFNAENCTTMGSGGAGTFDGCTSLTTLNIGERVKNIPSYAFVGCSGLTEITIPNSVTSIDNAAFYGCRGLTTVNFNAENCTTMGSSSNPVFANCTSLTTINIGEDVKNIPNSAFYNCSGLAEITIPDSVTSIGESAFSRCSGLTSVTIGNSVESIGGYAFSECSGLTEITIPDSITSIGDRAFSGCSGLTTVNFNAENCTGMGITTYAAFYNCTFTTLNIGEKVKNIPNYTFYNCGGLTTVNFNATNCTSMGSSVWHNCTSLTTLNIGERVKNIPDYAFYDCSALTGSLAIPDSVTNIGINAFYGCTGLTAINFNANNCTTMGNSSNPAFYNCTSLTTINIGEDVKNIPNYAFYNCSGLTGTLTIPDSVTNIGTYAFGNCSSIDTVTIGNSVENIGENGFYNCSALAFVTIGESVETIGGYAFHYCDNIAEINALVNTPPELGNQVFRTTPYSSAIVKVPCSTLDAYSSASGWSDFSNIQERFDYTLAVSSDNEQQGTASITQQPNCSDNNGIITATPATGYRFLSWNDGNEDNPRTVIVTSDSTFTAGFKAIYIITATAGEGGTITPSGEVSVDEGESQAFTITPNTGYRIASVMVDGTENVTDQLVDGVYTFENVTASHSIEATFEAIPSASFTTDPEASSDTLSIVLEQMVEYTNTSLNAHHIHWYFEGADTVESTQNYVPAVGYREEGTFLTTLVAYNEDETLTDTATLTVVVREASNYTITAVSANDEYGSVTGGGTYEEGATATLTAIPNQGYRFVSWSDDITDNPRTVTVTSDSTFVAAFVRDEGVEKENILVELFAYRGCGYSPYAAKALDNMEDTDSLNIIVLDHHVADAYQYTESTNRFYYWAEKSNIFGEIYGFDGTPSTVFDGYVGMAGADTRESAMQDAYTTYYNNVKAIKSIYSLTAEFEQTEPESRTFTLNVTAEKLSEYYGDDQIVVMAALTEDIDYDWSVAGKINNLVRVLYPDANGTEATFDGNNRFSTSFSITISEEYDISKCKVVVWVENHTQGRVMQSKRFNVMDFYNLQAQQYTITVLSNNDAYGSVTGGGTYDESSDVIIMAMPNQGYRFVSWNDNITDNPRTITVTSDSTFVANFEAEQVQQFTITVLSNNDAYGTVSGGGTYNDGDTIMLMAMPNGGYLFDSWKDGNYDNPRSINVTRDSTFIADFIKCEITQTIDTVVPNFVTVGDHTFYSTGNYTFTIPSETDCDTIFDIHLRVLAEPVYDISPNPTKSLLNINSDGFISAVEFYSVTGQLVMRREVNGYEAEFDMEGLVDGVYILRIYGEKSSLPAVSKIIKE